MYCMSEYCLGKCAASEAKDRKYPYGYKYKLCTFLYIFMHLQMYQYWMNNRYVMFPKYLQSICLIQQTSSNSRFHVEQVAHAHVGIGLSSAVTVALGEELLLGPGHVHAIGRCVCFVVHGGVWCCVAVVDELGLKLGRSWGKQALWNDDFTTKSFVNT